MGSTRRPPGRPLGSHIDARQRREDLLDAAERSLRSRGPELSLVDVARESGLTRSALYAAFPDKDALVTALAQRQAQRIVAEVSGIAAFDQLDGDRRAAGPRARALLGAVSASVFWWQRDRTVERDELVEHLTALIWSGFVGAGGERLRTLGAPAPD